MIKTQVLKENGQPFYPITYGEAVKYPDNTTSDISEEEMSSIFGWHRPVTSNSE